MPNTNDFVAFAIGSGANVETPATWAADSVLAQGFQSGVASSTKVNTPLRQATSIGAMIGQFTADFGPGNVQDNGNISNLETQFKAALRSFFSQGLFGPDTGAANALVITLTDPIGALRDGSLVQTIPANPNNASAVTATIKNSLGATLATGNCYRWDGTALAVNDIVVGPMHAFFAYDLTGNKFLLQNPATLLNVPIPPPPGATFYVNNSTGNDSNPGTSAAPFASIQGAINAISTKYQTSGSVTIIVQTGTGTMTLASGTSITIGASKIGAWNINGPGASSLTIDASATGCRGFVATSGAVVTITGFTVTSYYEAFLASGSGANITVHDCNVNLAGASALAFGAYTGGSLFAWAALSFAGSGYCIAHASQGSTLLIGYHDVNTTQAATLTFVTGITVNTVMVASDSGSLALTSGYITWAGVTPTGARYSATANGVIDTQGQSSTWIPGSSSGTTGTGGQYI